MMNPVSTGQTNTTVSISWNRPNFTEQVLYSIDLSDPSDNSGFQRVASNIADSGSTVSYVLSELSPFTPYQLKLTASSSANRTDVCQIVVKTAEGGKR